MPLPLKPFWKLLGTLRLKTGHESPSAYPCWLFSYTSLLSNTGLFWFLEDAAFSDAPGPLHVLFPLLRILFLFPHLWPYSFPHLCPVNSYTWNLGLGITSLKRSPACNFPWACDYLIAPVSPMECLLVGFYDTWSSVLGTVSVLFTPVSSFKAMLDKGRDSMSTC